MKSNINSLGILMTAMACHQANKVFCEANGDNSQKDWDEAEQWQKDSAIKGVQFRIDNPNAGHDAQHNSWMQEKLDQGWVYGEVKDADKKTHPCIVAFENLPLFQQKKDALFCAIVDANIKAINVELDKEWRPTIIENNQNKELTFGMKAVGIGFNPSGNQSVYECKKRYADQIDQLNDFRNDPAVPSEAKRLASVAITEAQGAQMWAVKSLTWTE